MAFIYDIRNNNLIEVEIVLANDKLPIKKDGWKFNWNKQSKEKNTKTYILRLKDKPECIEGVIQLKFENNMLIMNLVEIAPHNLGSMNKRFDFVAGCLIAFACRESFKIQGEYKGFLAFIAKSKLIDWYISKYGATQAMGQRMYIDDIEGEKLIEKFLE